MDAVHSGKLTEEQGDTVLRKAGFPDSHNPFTNRGAPGLGGVIHSVAKPLGLSRSENIKRDQAYAAATGEFPKAGGTVSVFPGATGLIGSTIAGAGAAAANAPGGVYSAVAHPGRTLGQLAEHARHPGPFDLLLGGYIGAVGGATAISRGFAARQALRSGAGARSAVTRSSAEGGGLLHTPAPVPTRVTIPGRRLEGPATAGGAVPRAEGISILRPVSRNALVRPLNRARAGLLQRSVNQDAGRLPGVSVGSKRIGRRVDAAFTRTFSGHTTIGRELRARNRVELAIENAAADDLNRALHGLTRGEHTAILAAAISGEEALTNPAAAISRQIQRHEHFAAISDETGRAANAQHIADLRLAQAALENPSEKLTRALALARQVATQTEERLIAAGHLTAGTAAGRQDAMADIYGYDAPPPGSFFVPMHSRYQNTDALTSGSFQPNPSPSGGIGPASASARLPGLHQQFEGGNVAAGLLPDAARATARRGVQTTNLLAVERQYDELFRVGTDLKRSVYDIPIRDTPQIRRDLKQFFAKLSDRAEASPDEILALSAQEAQTLRDMLVANVDGRVAPGSQSSRINGVRWVDSRYIAEAGPGGARSRLFKAADAITNPIRFSQLYARPAYILNLAGNIGMNGIADGARTFPSLKWAAQASKRTGPQVLQEVDAGMGVSLSRSYSVGTGPLGQLNDRAAEMWNRITDMHSRRAALRSQAARMGYKSDAQFEQLMTDPALREQKILAFRVANKNIVDYSSLTPFERDEMRRLIYFYPWVTRGTIWALRAMIENPLKSFTLLELGQIGAENAHRELGKNLPDWVRSLGLIPVGHEKSGRVKVINPASVWTPTTLVQLASSGVDTGKAALGLPHTMGGLGELLTPAATLLVQSSSRYEGGPAGTGAKGLAQSIPYVQAARRAGLWGEPSKTYPESGIGVAIGPLAIGGFYPRGISVNALADQSVRQQSTPRGKLRVQMQQAVELGLFDEEKVKDALSRLSNLTPSEVTQIRREIGPLLKAAYARQAQD